jgi:hypothetical protein
MPRLLLLLNWKAIEGAQAKAERLSALQTAAEELGFDSEGLSEEELYSSWISFGKLAKELAEQSAAASEEVLEILSEYLGVENIFISQRK